MPPLRRTTKDRDEYITIDVSDINKSLNIITANCKGQRWPFEYQCIRQQYILNISLKFFMKIKPFIVTWKTATEIVNVIKGLKYGNVVLFTFHSEGDGNGNVTKTIDLRWCYTRRFATTIFSAAQLCSIVATLFWIVTTLFQHCNAVLR